MTELTPIDIKRPPIWRFLLEWFRPVKDRLAAQAFLHKAVSGERGDGHKIIIIPGFMASSFSTRPMRSYLDRIGYQTVDWGLGRNYANLEQADVLSDLLLSSAEEGPVTVIGWSLGGIYARKLAAQYPEKIRKVITLASPYRYLDAPNNALWLFNLFQKLRGQSAANRPSWVETLSDPVDVPSVAFYTKQDGIVPWQACCDFNDQTDHQNIEVYTSHNALGVNKYVLQKLTEIL